MSVVQFVLLRTSVPTKTLEISRSVMIDIDGRVERTPDIMKNVRDDRLSPIIVILNPIAHNSAIVDFPLAVSDRTKS